MPFFVSEGGLGWRVLLVMVMVRKLQNQPLIQAGKAYAYLFAEV